MNLQELRESMGDGADQERVEGRPVVVDGHLTANEMYTALTNEGEGSSTIIDEIFSNNMPRDLNFLNLFRVYRMAGDDSVIARGTLRHDMELMFTELHRLAHAGELPHLGEIGDALRAIDSFQLPTAVQMDEIARKIVSPEDVEELWRSMPAPPNNTTEASNGALLTPAVTPTAPAKPLLSFA